MVNAHHPMPLRGPVAQCSDFNDKTKPGKFDMDKMAWAIQVKKGKIGFDPAAGVEFIPPSERRDIGQ